MMKSENVTDYERLLYVKSNVSTSSLDTRTKHGLFVLLPIQPEDITLEAYSNFTQILGLYGSSSSSSSSASSSSSSSSSSFSSSLLQDSEGNTVNDSKNITSDDTMDEPFTWTTDLWFRHSLAVSAVYCLAYTLVFVLGIIGNSFVVAVVFRAPRMRTVTNYFIVNLALADILVCLFCVPATLLSNIFTPWLLGLFMCKVVSFLQGVAVSASINTLVAVSADRFLAICYPLKCQMTRRWARYTIIAIWLFSLVIAFPWYMYFTLRPLSYETPDLMLCVEQWPDELFEVTYFVIANLCLCYIIPLFVITACYVAIWIKVWKRNVPGEKGFSSGKSLNNQIETIMQRSKLKVAKMMIVVVVIFVISWLPLYIIFARAKLGSPFKIGSTEERFFMTMIPIAQWLGASNSCINPVLYAFFNKKYRNGFAAIIKSRKCCGIVHQEQQQHQPSASVHYSRNTMRSNRLARFETQCEYVNSIAAV